MISEHKVRVPSSIKGAWNRSEYREGYDAGLHTPSRLNARVPYYLKPVNAAWAKGFMDSYVIVCKRVQCVKKQYKESAEGWARQDFANRVANCLDFSPET